MRKALVLFREISNLGEYISAMFSSEGFGVLLCACIFIASSDNGGSDDAGPDAPACSLSPDEDAVISGIKTVDSLWIAAPHIIMSVIKINTAMPSLHCLRRLFLLAFTVIFSSPYVFISVILHREIKVEA